MVNMVEIPGRMPGEINGTKVRGLGAQCPYCSKVADEYDYEIGKPLEIPKKCERCNSPMDIDASVKFANDLAGKPPKAQKKETVPA